MSYEEHTVSAEGLHLVDDGEVHDVHNTNGKDIPMLKDYLERYGLMEELSSE